MQVTEISVSYSPKHLKKTKINNSDDIYSLALNHWNLETIEMQEEVKAIFLNRNHVVIGIYELSKGGITGSIVDIKLLMSVALICLASSMVLVHNHPSGNIKPSDADYKITQKIKAACTILEINLLDHVIISKDRYYSLADREEL